VLTFITIIITIFPWKDNIALHIIILDNPMSIYTDDAEETRRNKPENREK